MATVKDDRGWQDKAKCRGVDPEIFFPDPVTVYTPGKKGRAEIPIAEQKKIDMAKAVCRVCPVKDLCRDYADATQAPDGIWGGETGDERRKRWKSLHRHLHVL